MSAGGDIVDPRTFRSVLGHLPTGVSVVTARPPDDRPAGLVVGSVTSVSLDPPLVAYLPGKGSTSFPRMRRAPSFCINVLSARQLAVCESFAEPGADKFEGIGWTSAPSGAPVLDGVVAWIDCRPYAVHEAGDHFIVVGEVRALGAGEGDALAFYRGRYGVVRSGP